MDRRSSGDGSICAAGGASRLPFAGATTRNCDWYCHADSISAGDQFIGAACRKPGGITTAPWSLANLDEYYRSVSPDGNWPGNEKLSSACGGLQGPGRIYAL